MKFWKLCKRRPVPFVAVTMLAILNIALLGSVCADKRDIRSKKTEIVADTEPKAEAVRIMSAWVRDEVYHCSRTDVDQMSFLRRWNYQTNPFRIGPVTVLRTGGDDSGACGSSSRVLMELLAAHDVPSRFAIIAGPDSDTHTILEVFYDESWGLVDPLYNIVYKRDDGRPASLQDLRADPDLYVRNAQGGWEWSYKGNEREKHSYNFAKYPISGARYFNYKKFGALSQGLHGLLLTAFGEEATLWIKRPNFYAYPALTTAVLLDTIAVMTFLLLACVRMYRQRQAHARAKQSAAP